MERSLTMGRIFKWILSVLLYGFVFAGCLVVISIGVESFKSSWRFYQPRTALIQYVDRYDALYQEMNRACYGKHCTDEQLAVFLDQRERLLAAAWPEMQSIMLPGWRWMRRPGESLIDGTIIRESDWSIRDSFMAMVDAVGGPEVAFTACVPVVYWQVIMPDEGMVDSFNGLRCGEQVYRMQ